jgi:DNA-binding MarR family transcriptional regulator
MIGLDPSTVSRHVRQLERQGLAVRDADPTDARAVSLEATAAGRDAIQRVRGARRALLERVLADWPAGDRRELARLLTRLTEDLTTVWRDA